MAASKPKTKNVIITARRWWWISIVGILLMHAVLLAVTHFTDWPEMIFYPWLITKHFLPYRTLTLMYTPVSYYLLLPWYVFFGFTPLTERAVASVVILISDLIFLYVLQSLFRRRILTLAIAVYFVVWYIFFQGNSLWYETILLPLLMLAFERIVRYLRSERLLFLLSAGTYLALAFMIKQTVLLPVIATSLVIIWQRRRELRKLSAALSIFLAPLVGFIGIFLLLAKAGGMLKDVWFWVFIFPIRIGFSGNLYQLHPSVTDVIYMLPVLFPFLLLLGVISFRHKYIRDGEVWLAVLWGVALFFAGSTRFALNKVVPLIFMAGISFAYTASLLPNIQKTKRVRFLIPVSLAILCIGQLYSLRAFYIRVNQGNEFFGAPYRELSAVIRSHTDWRPFFIMGNFDYTYMSVGVPPPLPYTPMFPWNWNVPGVQEQFISSLEEEKIPYVFYIPYHPDNVFYAGERPEKIFSYLNIHYYLDSGLPGGGYLYKRNFTY